MKILHILKQIKIVEVNALTGNRSEGLPTLSIDMNALTGKISRRESISIENIITAPFLLPVRAFTLLVFLFFFCLNSCTRQDDLYKEYLETDSFYYPGKPNRVVAHTGYEKIQLTWQLTADPGVKKIRVFWNNYADSLELDAKPDDFLYDLVIPLPEGNYTFNLHTYDGNGNKSNASQVAGASYGPQYCKSIGNRSAFPIIYYEDELYLEWTNRDTTILNTVISFDDISDPTSPVHREIEVTDKTDTTILSGVKIKDTLYITTTYKKKLWYEPITAAPRKIKLEPTVTSGHWLFDDETDVGKAAVGAALTAYKMTANNTPGSPSEEDLLWTTGPAAGSKAVVVPRRTYFKAAHGINANGGGGLVNEYTMLIDFKIAQTGRYYTFLQTSVNNNDDGDFFIRSAGNIGHTFPGFAASTVTPNVWHRLVISFNATNWCNFYLDGQRILKGNAMKVDDRWSLNPEACILFGDNDGDDNEMIVSEVAFFNGALTERQIQQIGDLIR